jgi:hypothetical protein
MHWVCMLLLLLLLSIAHVDSGTNNLPGAKQ